MALRLEDRDLVIAYQAGDDDAFAELVREYRPQLLGHARRSLGCPEAAEDAVQETLVRALRAMPRFNGNYRVGPWLHRILSNVCSDEGNRRRRDGEKAERYRSDAEALSPLPSTEAELGLDLDDTELMEAVDGLSEQYREALTLRFVDELSYEEVAQEAGISEQNARARVSRARSAVRAALRVMAAVPVALVGLLRRGERAATALSSGTPGASRAAVSSAMPVLAETAPMASRAAVAAANTAAVASTAVTGVPVVAKAAVGLGLATAVVAPTVDSPVHRAAEQVLPASVMEVLTPLAVEVPSPDAPVVVPAAPTDSGSSALPSAAVAAAAEVADTATGTSASEAPSEPAEAAESAVAAVPAQAVSEKTVADGSAAADDVATAPVEAPAAAEPTVTSTTVATVKDVELTFVPAGADRFDVSGALTMTLVTTTTTVDGDSTDETVTTSEESVSVVAPSTASLPAADPSDPQALQRFSALLVLVPSSGDVVEMRVAARGTQVDGSLPLEGLFTATPSEALPLAERGSLSGTVALAADGTPQSLTLTFGP